MGRVDLHLHTTHSDGQHRPSEVVRLASDAGLKLIAVTDHDTVGGIAESATAAARYGIGFIPGIEISTAHAQEQHMLGYYIDPGAPVLREICLHFMQLRDERIGNTIEYLHRCGIMITRADVQAEAPGTYLGRPHIAAAMVRAGYAADINEAFKKYLATDAYRKTPRPKPTAVESIEAIRAAGGTAALAHPDSLHLEAGALSRHVGELKSFGLAGLECCYGTYSRAQTALYVEIAKQHDLIVTGGSDFHGLAIKPDVMIGSGRNHLLDYNDLSVAEALKAAADA